jgi:hypothetical protein
MTQLAPERKKGLVKIGCLGVFLKQMWKNFNFGYSFTAFSPLRKQKQATKVRINRSGRAAVRRKPKKF